MSRGRGSTSINLSYLKMHTKGIFSLAGLTSDLNTNAKPFKKRIYGTVSTISLTEHDMAFVRVPITIMKHFSYFVRLSLGDPYLFLIFPVIIK